MRVLLIRQCCNPLPGDRMEIRTYRSEDRDQLVALWDTVFPNSTGHNEPNGAIERKVLAADSLFFVAADAGTIAGAVIAGYDGHRGWLYSLAVTPGNRRQGLGTRLVRHVEASLERLGCPKLNLQVRAENAEVAAFYESLGFATSAVLSFLEQRVRVLP